jgi:hypothetical protein
MKIGIDISQLAYEKTGVSNYLLNFVKGLIKEDDNNEYILFYSSLRKKLPVDFSSSKNVTIKTFKLPSTFLNLIWNKLHILPIETFIGPVDIFVTSDWTEPPVKKAKKATILYDLIVYKYPKETHEKIVEVQKRKLEWVKKETDRIFCISNSTAEDAKEILGIDSKKLSVIYPGF